MRFIYIIKDILFEYDFRIMVLKHHGIKLINSWCIRDTIQGECQIRTFSRYILTFTCNHCNPNIVDISGALFISILSTLILNSQCEEGARAVKNIWVTVVIFKL